MTLLPLVSIMIICEDQRAASGLLGQGSTANRITKHPKTHLYFLQMWPPCLIKNSIPCVLRNESMTQFNRCTCQFCREFWHQQHGSLSKYIKGKYSNQLTLSCEIKQSWKGSLIRQACIWVSQVIKEGVRTCLQLKARIKLHHHLTTIDISQELIISDNE